MTVPLVVLAVTAAALLGLTAATARRVPDQLPDRRAYAAIWQQQHRAGDVDATRGLVGGFLRFSYALAAPLARRGVLPDVLTLWGVWLAGCVAVVGALGSHWPLIAGLGVVISALTDGVDGCVAGLTGRATARGYVLDSVADRTSDALFAAAIVLAGGAAWSAAAAVGALMMLEYLRARAGNAGLGEVGVVTVGERPSRIIAAVIALLAMGLRPDDAAFIGTGSLLVMTCLGAVGFLQLATHLWRTLD